MISFTPAASRCALPPAGAGGETVGLIAGWGDFPWVVARGFKARGWRIVCLGVRDHADPKLADFCDNFAWIGLASLGRALRHLRRQGVKRAVMAGKIHKVVLFSPDFLWRHVPDLRSIRAFFPHFVVSRKDRQDDTLLSVFVNEAAKDGIEVVPATHIMPELLVKFGQLTRRGVSHAQQQDIAFGWKLAREMGRLDVGQSVAVKCRAVLAVEAIEGTDACIRRAGALCRSGGFTVVKVAKPQQDMRFDVPTVGLGTLQAMVDAGASVLAIEADKTILLHGDQFVQFADRHGLAIVALRADGDCAALQSNAVEAA